MATKKTSNTEIDQGIFNNGWDQDKFEAAVWKFNPDRIRAIRGEIDSEYTKTFLTAKGAK